MRVLAIAALVSSLAGSAIPAPGPIDDLWSHSEPETSEGSGGVRIGGTITRGGSSEDNGRSSESSGSAATVAWTPPPGIPPWVVPAERCVAQGDIAADCTAARPGAPAAPPPADAAPGTPGITIRDVASFRPELATLSSEPSGWAVRGLDANILATGGSSVRTGELFGTVAEVRFTPVAYLFDYGDGSAPLSTSTPGATWASLGLDEFDPTPTSHAYAASGTYTVTLLVDYAAEYRIGGSGDFTPIPGTLAIPSSPIEIVVADGAQAALVHRDCVSNPRGPGC
ncbi:MAG: hypothetical protein Q7T15_10880 [Microcella sp.]|uniref:PKD domain-containing protein n=1 Tax=Microcella sp. TaxID=1913979 RepID=UPI002720FC41|nr:hypothetical protein [Microcella sp.]MDO8338742.1 hypothetical protein [Microcella sp.]